MNCVSFQITKVSGEFNANHQLNKEARKWATKIAKEDKTVRDTQKQITQLREQKATGTRKVGSKKWILILVLVRF